MVREEVPPGTAIVTEGEHTDRFYVLLSGLAAVTQDGRGARAVIRPGETFGEVAPLMRMERTATVTAMTACVVASCDRATFDELLRPLYVDDATQTHAEASAEPRPRGSPRARARPRPTARPGDLRPVAELAASSAPRRRSPRSGSTQRNVPLPPKWPNVRGEVSEPDQWPCLRRPSARRRDPSPAG